MPPNCSPAGDLGKLQALLRQHQRTQLFNSALLTVAEEQLHAVVEELVQCACGSSSSSSSSDRQESSHQEGSRAGPGTGSAARAGSSCRPDHLTARALLHRLARSGMHAEVNSLMQLLLRAGLPPNYKSFLPWASFHARRGSVGGVRHVMAQVEAYEGPGAAGGHYYVQLVRVGWGGVGSVGGGVGWGEG